MVSGSEPSAFREKDQQILRLAEFTPERSRRVQLRMTLGRNQPPDILTASVQPTSNQPPALSMEIFEN